MTINKDICGSGSEKTPKKYVNEEEVGNVFSSDMIYGAYALMPNAVEREKERER